MGINVVANFVSPAYDISSLYPEKIDFCLGGLITLILSVMVCPWVHISSPQAITIFVSIFGAALGPMFGIMVSDYVVKRPQVVLGDLYTVPPMLHFANGRNTRALRALAGSAAVSIGMVFAGAYGLITNVGDWGRLIGATLGGLFCTALMRGRAISAPSGAVA